jgi:hypothetical protein
VPPFEPGLLLRVCIANQLTGELLDQEFSSIGLSRRDFAVTSSLRLRQPATVDRPRQRPPKWRLRG